MKAVYFLVALAALALASSIASAYDPHPVQDICVAIKSPKNAVFVNGKFCKDPKEATADDFLFSGLNIPTNTSNIFGFNVTFVDVNVVPGLNTMATTFVRIDFAPGGMTPPHYHPRATEVLLVVQGTIYAGFVTQDTPTSPYRLFSKILHPGDVFVFPLGLIHFQLNVGKTDALIYGSLNSQDPGFVTVSSATFGTTPPINPNVLTTSFQLDKKTVLRLQKLFGGN